MPSKNDRRSPVNYIQLDAKRIISFRLCFRTRKSSKHGIWKPPIEPLPHLPHVWTPSVPSDLIRTKGRLSLVNGQRPRSLSVRTASNNFTVQRGKLRWSPPDGTFGWRRPICSPTWCCVARNHMPSYGCTWDLFLDQRAWCAGLAMDL